MARVTCCKTSKKSKEDEDNASAASSDSEENTERGNWASWYDAILSYIGFAVGLGSVWRFPFLVHKNGGGAFLIPFFLSLIFVGMPFFYLELALGQYSSTGAISVWKLSPMFKGIGYCMLIICSVVNIYYNVIIAYVLYYLFASFTSRLPWSHCENEWNTPNCRSIADYNTLGANSTGGNDTFVYGAQDTVDKNITLNRSLIRLPTEEFWERSVLGLSSGMDELGGIQWRLTLCLFLAWIIIFLCVIRGVKSSGKVVWVTATMPYVMLTVLLIRGVTLEGAKEGLLYFIVPTFDRLKDPWVWGDAATQVFYALGPAWGIVITYGSYTKFHTNCQRDAIISSMFCCFTGLLAGLVVFSTVGFIAHQRGVEIKDVMLPGAGLVFVVYPEALSQIPLAPFWSIIFFIMLLFVALDSQFAQIENVVSALVDEFPELLRKRKILFTAAMCFFLFLLGIPETMQSGIYLLTLMDASVGSFPLILTGFFEICVVNYVYGFRRFRVDIETMLGFKPNLYWMACWVVLTPLAVFLIVISMILSYKPLTMDEYHFPQWSLNIGWAIVAGSLGCIPLYMVYKIACFVISEGSLSAVIARIQDGSAKSILISPDPSFGPALRKHRAEREAMEGTDNSWYDIVKMDDMNHNAEKEEL